jgi:hypothetical protein
MLTSELKNAALDWAVANCEGFPVRDGFDDNCPEYSTDWAQGGPIIEREGINLEYAVDPEKWCACIMADQEVYGPTALIAAMRCYVSSKLGDDVEIPKELQ